MKLFGIEFAPLLIPHERRIQTFSVIFFVFLFLQGLSLIGWFSVFYLLLFTKYYWLSLLYGLWYYYDRNSCHRGGRSVAFIRHLGLWKYFRDYFPIHLIKTSDLKPDRNYIMGLHPHGIMSFAPVCHFCTNSTGFEEKFPGLTPHLMTLVAQFNSPLTREFLLATGAGAASEENLRHILTNKSGCEKKGQVCGLIIGGAAESIEAHPQTNRLVLNKRKGFARIALMTGASLVPVYSFGETDAYYTVLHTYKSSKLRKFQEFFLRLLGVGLPLLMGRGIFNYSLGLLPFRKPIYTVIGKPIHIDKPIENPTNEQVNELHAKYVEELIKLFEEYKYLYLKSANTNNNELKIELVK